MGQSIRKRKDYSIEEIEKKYSKHELNQLILYNNLSYYKPIEYIPEKLCEICNKNPITKKNQLSGNKECMICHNMIKQRSYDYIINHELNTFIIFEGDCILENKLYLGNISSSFLKDKLKELGITHILMVSYFVTPIFPNDFIYENIEVNDNTNENILIYLVKGVKFIEQSKICYTHCQLGKSRSASFVIAYVMYKKKIHFSEAYDFVRAKRHKALPNEGFQCQLEDFDIILYNFDYDLDKCDEFIKSYFDNREKLIESEKDFLEKRKEEKKNKQIYEDEFYNKFEEEEEDIPEEEKIEE